MRDANIPFSQVIYLLKEYNPKQRPKAREAARLETNGFGPQTVEFLESDGVPEVVNKITKYSFTIYCAQGIKLI